MGGQELKINFAEAVVGFKHTPGGMQPKVEGIVICNENRQRLMAAHATKQAAKARQTPPFTTVHVTGRVCAYRHPSL